MPALDAPHTLLDLIIAFPFFMTQVCTAYARLMMFGPTAEAR